MKPFLFTEPSKIALPLDPDFSPMVLNNQLFEKFVLESINPQTVSIAIVRSGGQIARVDKKVFHESYQQFEANYRYIERYVKTILWLKGGYKVIYSGPRNIGLKLIDEYSSTGKRAFDADFMSGIYQQPFTVEIVEEYEVPQSCEKSIPLGRHLDGYRIGFDAGGSDRKVSAVVNGEAIYSEEVVWHPKEMSDSNYHYQGILDSMKRAASKMPRVDAIGISSAGIFIDNEVAAASLFRKVPTKEFDELVRPIYKRVAREIGDVPMEVANDGDVTALAGAMSLDSNNVLGIAMGTSQAAGYVDSLGNITGWLNELSFVPVDYNITAMEDEWSGDAGVGVTYFSQDAVIKLAANTSIVLDHSLAPAEKLKIVQEEATKNNPEALEIFKTIGIYLGYSIAYYSEFYEMDYILILGRVTSSIGGELILKYAKEVLENEFSKLNERCRLTLPDEQSRRVGQSIAAASLPQIKKEGSI